MIVVCARESPRSAIISARSRKLSLYRRYQRTQSTMISWSKCRPLNSPSIFVCARQLCRSTDLPTTMLCPSSSHQSQPKRLVDQFEVRLEFADAPHYEAHVPIGVHEAGIQVERASVLGNRFVEAKLGLEYKSFNEVSRSVVWIECKRFRHQFVGPLEFVLRVVAAAARRQERYGQVGQGTDV